MLFENTREIGVAAGESFCSSCQAQIGFQSQRSVGWGFEWPGRRSLQFLDSDENSALAMRKGKEQEVLEQHSTVTRLIRVFPPRS